MPRWEVTLQGRNRVRRTLTVRASDASDAIVKAENLVEGTAWFPLFVAR